MAHRNANLWSRIASRLTAASHTRAGAVRWILLIALTLVWIVGGLYYWRERGPLEALYLTVSAVGMWDGYFDANDVVLQVVRYAALAVPVVGLLFAFSGQLGRALARLFNLGAEHHVVIAGESPDAMTLALDCRRSNDSVILLAQGLSDDAALGLRRKGITVIEGDATHQETLRGARANHASHVVAFAPDDTVNLQIEAAVRRLVGDSKRKPPISVHVSTRSSVLLKEAREMRSMQMRRGKDATPPIDPKPFSLEEISARALIQRESQNILSLAKQLGQDRVHVVFFGFDQGGEAVAERVLVSMWSAHFGAPRITVLSPDPEATGNGFRARHREAFAHPQVWAADAAFMPFDWDAASVSDDLLSEIEKARGKPTAIVVATGTDPGNIHLAMALKRACNRGQRWPAPIFMRQTSESEFSKEYAKGDETEELDAYLQAFGAHQSNATRSRIIDGNLDRGAAIAHEHYNKGLGKRDAMSMKELQAATRDWADVPETYRAANRAVSDSAMTKLWDAGWAPMKRGERGGETAPAIPDAMIDMMARREHDRWMAERLVSGWRPTAPGEKRNNDLMIHDKIVSWDALSEADKNNDVVQVRAAIDVARATHKEGFAKRT